MLNETSIIDHFQGQGGAFVIVNGERVRASDEGSEAAKPAPAEPLNKPTKTKG